MLTDDGYRQLMKHAQRLAQSGHGELAQHLRDAIDLRAGVEALRAGCSHAQRPTAKDIEHCEDLARDRMRSSFTSALFENVEPEDTEDFAQHLALLRLIEWAKVAGAALGAARAAQGGSNG